MKKLTHSAAARAVAFILCLLWAEHLPQIKVTKTE